MNSAQQQVRSALRQVAAATPSGMLQSAEETQVLRTVRVLGAVAGAVVKMGEGMEREPAKLDEALRERQATEGMWLASLVVGIAATGGFA